MNTKFKFISLTILFSLIFTCLTIKSNYYALEVNTQGTSDSKIYILVIKEGHNGQDIANTLKNTFSDINVDYKEEINVINLEIKDANTLNNIKNYIDENHKSSIERMGSSFKIEIDPMINKIIPSLSQLKSEPFISSSSSDAFSDSFDAVIEDDLLSSSSSSDSYYESFRWDIDAVTDNRSTYDIEMGNHDIKVGIIDSGIDVKIMLDLRDVY